MAALIAKNADESAAEQRIMSKLPVTNALGERGARTINAGWKGDFVGAANGAAFEYGLLVAGNMLPQDRAKDLLEFHFNHRKVDDKYWSAICQSFLNGRDSGISHAGTDGAGCG
jgi:hypothetical protein